MVTSPITVFIDIVTAGVCNGMNLTMQVGQVLGEGAIMPTSLLVDGHRCSRVSGLGTLIENGAR